MTPADLKALIRTVPDFPKAGILFRDITTLIANGPGFAATIALLAEQARGAGAQAIAGMEARGFIFGAAVAAQLALPFLPVRKPGKLPGATLKQEYALEYGTDRIEVSVGATPPGARVLLVDDVLATGGTLLAALQLAAQLEAQVVGGAVLVELDGLGGRERWPDGLPLTATLVY